MKAIIDIDNLKEYLQEEVYKTDLSEVMPIIDHYCKCFNEIPYNATNGDMIKTMFPKAKEWEVTEYKDVAGHYVDFGEGTIKVFALDWWNAPYKAESEGIAP